MSGVFRNIDSPPPHRPAGVYPLPLVRGDDTLAGWRGGWGVNSSEDARHCSVLYKCKFVNRRIYLPKKFWKINLIREARPISGVVCGGQINPREISVYQCAKIRFSCSKIGCAASCMCCVVYGKFLKYVVFQKHNNLQKYNLILNL